MAASTVSNTRSWTAQPNSGRIVALARRGGEDQLDRLLDVLLAAGEREPAARVHVEREGDA